MILPIFNLSGKIPLVINWFIYLDRMGLIIWADRLIIFIGMSLALLFSSPLIVLLISSGVESCRYILDGLDCLRNTVKGCNGLMFMIV